MSNNEIELLRKAQDGDVESFEQLIKEHQQFIYNIALKYMKDPDDAKDIAQEALIKIYKSIENFKMNSKFSTWIYTIVVNTCKDELRSQKKDFVSMNDSDENNELINNIEDDAYEPLHTYERKELIKKVRASIDQLPTKYKEIVTLCDLGQMSYKEISEILDIPLGTVRSRIARGRKLLKSILIKMEQKSEINV